MRRLLAAVVAAAAGVGTAATVSQAASRPPGRLLVTATEFRLALSRATLPAGRAIVQLSDRGQDPHDLVARRLDRHGRPTGPAQPVPLARPGTVSTARLTLRAGRWLLFCSLPGHRARGMQARLRVR